MKCSIKDCKEKGIKRYDLFLNNPHFMTLILCKKHSKEADIQLKKKGLKVNPDGTYSKL